MSNAVKFTERGSVQVRVELAGRSQGREHLQLIVQDTGVGIPEDCLAHLFQPFAQADAGTTAKYGGTGLGLFIARRLSELMGGAVSLSSVPGEGTTATLSLALEVCRQEETQTFTDSAHDRLDALVSSRPRAPSLAQAEADGTLLLVVDDHPINRMVILRQVTTLGYAAEASADGRAALSAWESGRFGAIITDCNMPRMNGLELAREIRAREARTGRRRATIIGCTANALSEATASCLAAGMDDVVTKPVMLQEICRCLDRWAPLRAVTADVASPALSGAPLQRAGGLLDPSMLDAISGGDPGIQAAVVRELRRNNEADATALRRAVSLENFPEIAQISHRVRGACAMFGATLLAEASLSVQAAAAAKDLDLVHRCMHVFDTELVRLTNDLAAMPS